MVSIVSLAVGIFFKFISPILFDYSLSRAAEMSVGVGLPLLLLAVYEWAVFGSKVQDPQFTAYQQWLAGRVMPSLDESEATDKSSASQNTFALRAIAISFALTGLGIAGLGINSGEDIELIAGVGAVIVVIAAWIGWSTRTRNADSVQNAVSVEDEF